eukprot:TRINITY_DN16233_c0_g1_i2.p1 TRINITY_DN16233_c0_g1~~TRINITY_DN16233_c0_g1_i2.p1  ORF type:complete len:135 (+),score=22.94 TRINITY_DN16233_c0_g1_i2:31-435(+)
MASDAGCPVAASQATEPTLPPAGPPRGFTAEELAEFNGTNDRPIYLSLKNVVYSVSPDFYGPGKAYHAFAGKESTIPLAKSVKVTDEECNQSWYDLSAEDLKTADEWEAKYRKKYPVVGWFVAPWVREAQNPVH